MPSLLRWLSDMVGSIYIFQVLWPYARTRNEDRVAERTADLMLRHTIRSAEPALPLELVFRFVGAARADGGVTALFVNEGAAVQEVVLGA